jgi:hypothetical protein
MQAYGFRSALQVINYSNRLNCLSLWHETLGSDMPRKALLRIINEVSEEHTELTTNMEQ